MAAYGFVGPSRKARAAIGVALLSISGGGALAAGSVEERIARLEARIRSLEDQLDRARAAPAAHRGTRASRSRAAAAPAPAPSPAAANAPGVPAPPAGAAGREAPQESFAFRENTASLRANRFEAAQEFTYMRSSGVLQSDRAVESRTSLRYGLTNDVELGLTIPAHLTNRRTQLAPGVTLVREKRTLGDIVASLTANLWKDDLWYPGASISASITAPTGDKPYDAAAAAISGGNPLDPLSLTPSRGHWAGRVNVQFFKTVDPLILFGGFGYEQSLSANVAGLRIRPGARFLYNMGVSFAASEKTTIAFSVLGDVSRPLRVNGRNLPDSTGERLYGRLMLVQRLDQDLYLEPSLQVGLTKDTPDAIIGLGLRKRF